MLPSLRGNYPYPITPMTGGAGHVAMPSASRPPPQDGQTEGAHPCTWLDVAAHRAAVLRRSAFVPQAGCCCRAAALEQPGAHPQLGGVLLTCHAEMRVL